MRGPLVLLVVVVLAGCGGAAKKEKVTRHQPQIVARLTGAAAEKVGAASCAHLPKGTLPQGSRATKIAALRAYLQTVHPTDSIPAMLRGCERTLHL